jgi:hypothetical protein
MWVQPREVQLSRDEEDDGVHGGEAGVAAGLALGGLEQTVEGLDEAIGLSGLGPGDNAVEVFADHPGHVLHWRQARAHDIGAPLSEHGGDEIDLLAVEDLAQLLAIEPGAGGALAGGLGDQGIKVGPAGGGQVVAVFEQGPAQPLEARIGPLFETPGAVEGGGGMGEDVKLVEGDTGVWQVVGDTFDEGVGHVDADRADLLGRPVVFGQVFGEAGDGGGVATLSDEHQTSAFA